MKSLRYILFFMAMALAIGADAKPIKTNQVHMFGFSASFKDSVIYVTDIQNVQGVWIDTKTKFLLARNEYSYQLKNFLAEKRQQPDRVCMTFFATSKKKAEKMYLKLIKKYKKGYDVRYINVSEFKFEPVEIDQE